MPQLSLCARIAAVATAGLVICVSCMGGLVYHEIYALLYARGIHNLGDKVVVLAELMRMRGEPAIKDGRLMFGDTVVDGNDALIDGLATTTDLPTVSFFKDDVRVATTAKGANGARAVGSRFVPGPLHDTVFDRGQPVTGETLVAGAP